MSKNIHQEHVLTLQIGHETNSILSYLWATRELDLVDEEGRVVFESNYHNVNEKDQLVPKVVMIDNQYNDLDPNEGIVDIHKLQKNIPWEGPRTTVNRSTATRPFAKATHKPYYSKTKFHSKSFVTFDAVDEKENSHWYYQRSANNGIRESTEDSEEVASDAIRYFAEASDRVDAIDVFADIYGDLGYTTSRIVEQLRDDYSKSVSIPLWLLDHCHVYNYHVQQHHRLAPEKTSKLFDNSLALNYANLHESADLLIPIRIPLEESIEDLDARFFHYRLTGAVALEASLAFRHMHRETDTNDTSSNKSENSMTTKEWINLTSNGYRLPIVSMEAFIPALTHDVTMNQDYLFHSLNELKLHSQYHLHQFQYNPFMKSFAIPSLLNSNKKYDHYTRPFTNSLAFRGISGPDFVEKLFVECIQSSYLITKSNCYSYCLPVKWQESTASDVSVDDFVAATAIGSNAALGDHIREEAVGWYESALTALPQYAKIDIGKDDLETKRELLLQLSELYL